MWLVQLLRFWFLDIHPEFLLREFGRGLAITKGDSVGEQRIEFSSFGRAARRSKSAFSSEVVSKNIEDLERRSKSHASS
jgi:hypothetical protein